MSQLTLSNSNEVIAGVCGGIAEYFEIDPVIVRLIFVALGFIEPITAILFYIVLMFVIPKDRSKKPNKSSREAVRQMHTGNMNKYSSVKEMKKEIINK